jgi:AcrR family transcriptional regulator
MSPRNNVSEQRKSQILEAAKGVFSKHGFHNTRMADIAEESGLSKGALYWYFESKDAIILSLLEKLFEPEIRDFQTLLKEDCSAEEKLQIYIERAAEDIQKTTKWMPLTYEFFAMAFRRDRIRNALTSFFQRNMRLLETLIQQGIDSGEFQADSAQEAAIAIGSLIEGTVILWMYDPSKIDIKAHIHGNTGILLKGLRTDG